MAQNPFNDFVSAVDNHNVANGDKSWFEQKTDTAIEFASDVIEFSAKGPISAVAAGAISILNSAVAIANIAGADIDPIKTHEVLQGLDSSLGDYYKAHEQGIEIGGFALGMFVPGTAAVKAVNAAKAGYMGTNMAKSLGLMDSLTIKYTQLAKAESALNTAPFNILNENTLKALAAGAGASAIDMGAFNTGVAVGMFKSPILDDKSISDLFMDDVKDTVIFGGLGGIFRGFALYNKVKQAGKAADQVKLPFNLIEMPPENAPPLVKVLSAYRNKFDIPDVTGPFPNMFAKTGLKESEVVTLLDQTKNATLKRVDEIALGALTELAGGDNVVGIKLFDQLQNVKSFQDLSAVFLNTESIARIGKNDTLMFGDVQFIKPTLTKDELIAIRKSGNHAELFAPEAGPSTTGFQIVGDLKNLRIATAGTSKVANEGKQLAFDTGHDIYINTNGSVSINPESEILKITPLRPSANAKIIDLESGDVVTKARPNLADLSTKANPVTVNGNVVRYGNEEPITIGTSKNFRLLDDPYLEIQARYVWAQEAKINWEGMTISANDLPLLERLYAEDAKLAPGTSVYIETTAGRTPAVRGEALGRFIEAQKYAFAQEMVGLPVEEMALRLNTTENWLTGATGDITKIKQGYDYKAPRYARLDLSTDDSLYPMLNANNHDAALEYGRKVQMINERNKQTFSNFAGGDSGFFPDPINFRDRKPTREGAGSSFAGFANGEYFSVGAWAQSIGQQVDKLMLRRKTVMADTLNLATASVKSATLSNEAVAELSLLNNKFLQSESRNPWMFNPLDSQSLIKREDFARITKDPLYVPSEVITIKSPEVAEWWRVHQKLLGERQAHVDNMKGNAGAMSQFDASALYGVPIDTSKLKHFVMVKPLDPISLPDKMRVIAAKDEQTLQKLINQVDTTQYEVITKTESENFHKAMGDYKYSLGFNESHVDSALTREGKLSQHFPDLGEAFLDHAMNFHLRQEEILTRSVVANRYSQNFEELRSLGERYVNLATSQFTGNTLERMEKVVNDPYNDVIKTALNISRASEYPAWTNFNNFIKDSLELPVNKLRELFRRTPTIDPAFVDNVNQIIRGMGQGQPLRTAMDVMLAGQNVPNKPWIQPFVAKLNSVLSTTLLQWDTFNAINNTVSTAILAAPEINRLRSAILSADSAIGGKLAELTSVKVPGQGYSIPSTSRLLFNAVTDFIKGGDAAANKLNRYQEIGAIGSLSQELRQSLDSATLNYGIATANEADKALKGVVDFGRKWTGNQLAEQFTRFVSAHVANQITDLGVAAKVITEKEANEVISLFTNRTQGNYLFSQRPIVFQGVVGQAVGLFQTYQFNLMQQLFKYVAEGDAKATAILAGMQSSIYGMQGMPAFNFINHNIVGNSNGNTDHRDLYNASYTTFGKTMGDWLLYGLGSNALGIVDSSMRVNLYSRGDINPRQLTVLPTTIDDIPIVAASTKFLGNIFGTFGKVANGADVLPAITQAIEHNGISRPLAGLGQIVQGYTTSNRGTLLTSAQDFWSISTLARVGGAKPFEESVALDMLYRIQAYQAKDTKEIQNLGAAIKTTVVGQGMPDGEQISKFAAEYAKSGGRIENFNKYFSNLMLQANQSQVNKVAQNLNNRFAVQVQQIIGGTPVPDFMASVPQ